MKITGIANIVHLITITEKHFMSTVVIVVMSINCMFYNFSTFNIRGIKNILVHS